MDQTEATAEDRPVPAGANCVQMASDATRQRLLKAAIEVFAARGYGGARVQDIARRAGLTTGAIYACFRNKAELFFKVANELITSEFEALLQQEQAEHSPKAQWDHQAASLLVRLSPPTRVILLEGFAAANRDPEAAVLLRESFERKAQEMCTQMQARGVRSDISQASLTWFFQALLAGSFLLGALELTAPPVEEWLALMGQVKKALGGTGASSSV